MRRTCTTLLLLVALAVPLCTMAQDTETEPNNSLAAANPVQYGVSMTGSLGACDPTDTSDDYFSFTPPGQGVIRIQANVSTSGPAPVNVNFTFYGGTGGVIVTQQAVAGANNVAQTNTLLVPCRGPENVRLRIQNPAGGFCTNYTFTFDMIDPVFDNDVEPNNILSQSNPVALDTWAEGQVNFTPGDNTDHFQLQLPTNGQLFIDWEAEHYGGTAGTATLTLYASNGATLNTWTVGVGANATPVEETVTMLCRGDQDFYRLRVASGICGTSYRFRYRVTAPLFEDDVEPNNSLSTSTPIDVDTYTEGQVNFHYGDNNDYYQLQLPTNGQLFIDWEAEHAGTTAGQVTLTLYASNGATLNSWTVPVGAGSAIATETVTMFCRGDQDFYRLRVISNTCGTSYRFRYRVTPPVFEDDEEPNNSAGTAIILPIDTYSEGQIDFHYGDNFDFYRLTLPANGILYIDWEAEHAGSTPATATLTLNNSSGATLTNWNVGVGANSVVVGETVSMLCRGNTNFYTLRVVANVCGASYRLRYRLVEPVFGIIPGQSSSFSGSVPIDLEAAAAEGQINFYQGLTDLYYQIVHPGGPLELSFLAEHADVGNVNYSVTLYTLVGGTLQAEVLQAGGNSEPLAGTADFGERAAATYRIRVHNAPCGMSFRILCNDDDDDGVCNAFDLCDGPEPGTPCDDGDPTTGNDVITEDCECVGQLIDCQGVAGGSALPGTPCDDSNPDTGNDTWDNDCNCVGIPIDCNGVIGGTAFIDDCNECVGGNTGELACVQDCNGDFGGTAFIDNCGDCVGGNTGEEACLADCNGDFGGTAFIDNCGDCVGGNTGEVACAADCNGDFGGTAFIDNCGDCVGGNTGEVACVADCNGDFGGTAFIDNCGDCVGGNTGEVACVADCNGDFGGTAFIDNCGDCVGGNTGEVACVQDCNGDFGGTAFIDSCGDCVGGNTGLFPCGIACTDVTLEINTDLSASQTTWAISDAATSTVLCNGGPYADGFQLNVTENCCLPDGCYTLTVFDSAGDGILNGFNGGYQLRLASDNRRIIDNQRNGGFGSVSQITGNAYSFCLPIGDVEPIYTSCDKFWWRTGEFLVATPDDEVSAEWIVGVPNNQQSTTSGYEFWFYDPNGGYSFRRFRNHRTSDGFGNVGAVRACHMKVNNWAVANHIPEFDLMNVRIRPVINGVSGDWGPACRFVRDEALAQCPPTKLMDIPGNQFLSCGQFRQFGVHGQRIHARPVRQASQYEWRFRIPAENIEIIRSSNNYFLNLNWGPGIAPPLEAGKTYEVDVRALRNGAWCVDPLDPDSAWGDICLLTIQNSPAQEGGQNLALVEEAAFSLWPNPNSGDQFWLSFAALGGAVELETITVDIHDLTGKRVLARELAVNEQGAIHTVIDLNPGSGPGQALANGMYLVSIIAGEKRYTERMVIAR
jgi:hypothetical protein